MENTAKAMEQLKHAIRFDFKQIVQLVPKYLKAVKDYASNYPIAIEELELIRLIAKATLYLPNNIELMMEMRDLLQSLRDMQTKDDDSLLKD